MSARRAGAADLADGALSADVVVVRPEPARCFLALRRIVSSFAAARTLIVAHSPHFEHEEIDVEFGFVLDGTDRTSRPTAPLHERELEAVAHMAVCVRVGLPEDAHLVTARIGRFLEASGYALAGPGREAFVQPPDLERMHEAVVEMQFPVQPRTLEPVR